MKTIETIRAEIERLKELHKTPTFKGDEYEEGGVNGYQLALDKLLSFLDTLESEKPMNQEGLEEELDRFIASGKSVTVEDCGTYKVSYHDFKKVARHFAYWQTLRDNPGLKKFYEKGWDDCKEQMMKEAVETELYWDGDFLAIDLNMAELGYSERDKVRIIIVKEDDN